MTNLVETGHPLDFMRDIINPLALAGRTFSNLVICMRHSYSSCKLDSVLSQMDTYLQKISPSVASWMAHAEDSPIVFQTCIAAVWGMRDLHYHLSQLRFMFESTPLLSKSQLLAVNLNIEKFVTVFGSLDSALAQKANFPLTDASIKNSIGDKPISAPFRVLIEDDDTGKHVSCFEIPQVYGFGENEEEAQEMLDREILSLYADIHEDIDLSAEYEVLRIFLDMVFRNEEYTV